ncbi:arginine-tRNA-protein transferase [Lentinula edodes]|uniref:arginine-tRNA-protein transferase n=1 Tax=Lentinula edodes TaxID=5353 RepID=UPI001E8CD671|nr:arginine-tRNA-protein transferase [Lentinula edodes]KAH7879686.1 arginine-tRNA-protein transferase [Lentinula edodes]
MIFSVGQPIGRHASSCGYCSPSGERSKTDSSHTAASLVALQLSSEVYQMMLNRGWRRSGRFCYKPHLRSSCCPLYTIKLDVLCFKSSKHHKKLQKGKDNAKFNLRASIHASEFHSDQNQHFAHKFEMTLEPSSYTDEKYELFKKYQTEIHFDSTSPKGFRNFLVATPESPEQQEPIQYSSPPTSDLPTHYGSYHWCYRLDGKLIAISVIDILPECVSSVYFMYDKDYEAYSLGKLSALKENVLAQELYAAGAPSLKYLYLGYYVHSCQKMRYKGEYQPSFLCDPETFEWYPFADCTALLAEYRYACFSRPERSLRGEPDHELEQDFKESHPQEPEQDTLERVFVISEVDGPQISVIPANLYSDRNSPFHNRELFCCIEELGVDLASKIFFQL